MENDINITPPPLEPMTANGNLPLAGQAPEPIPVQPKPKTRLIILLVILGIAIAGYFVSAKYLDVWPFQVSVSIPTYTPRPTADNQLAGWQTYRNEEYGFEIKYPEYLTKPIGFSDSSEFSATTASDSDGLYIRGYSLNNYDYSTPEGIINCIYYNNSWTPYRRDPKTKMWTINVFNTNQSDCPQKSKNVNQVTIYNLPFSKITSTSATLVPIDNKNMMFVIFMSIDNPGDQKVWDQILSTFKFIEPVP